MVYVFLFPGMLSAQVASSGFHFSRSDADVATFSNDDIGFMFWEKGHYYTTSGHDEILFTTGGIHEMDMSRSIEGYSSPFNTYSIIIPREEPMDLEIDLDNLHLTHLSQKSSAVRLLRRHIYALQMEAPNMGQSEAQAMTKATVAMVNAVLSLQNPTTPGTSKLIQRNQLLEIRRYIDTHLCDPNLTPERIANEIGVSRTQLYRLTEPLNGIKHFITRCRLKRAFQRLASPGDKPVSITNLAYDLGFNSEDAFRRAFTKTFSMSPKEVRARRLEAYYAIATKDRAEEKPAMPTGERLYKQWLEDLFC